MQTVCAVKKSDNSLGEIFQIADGAPLPVFPDGKPVKVLFYVDVKPSFDSVRETLQKAAPSITATTYTENYVKNPKSAKDIAAALQPQMDKAERRRKIRSLLDEKDALGILTLLYEEGEI